MFGLINRGELNATTEHEFENLLKRLKRLWLKEHSEDGTHRLLDASVIPELDASKIVTGEFDADRIPDLDAAKITSGTLSDARLSANVALEGTANVFTANQRINAGLGVNVAPGATGEIKTSAGIYEHSRTTAMGNKIDIAHNDADYTGSATGTADWVVEAADQVSATYSLIGNWMQVGYTISNSTIANGPTQLRIAIPGGKTASIRSDGLCTLRLNGATPAAGTVFVSSSGTTINIEKFDGLAFTNSADNNNVAFIFAFWVN